MHKKNVEECLIIEKSEICKIKLIKYFMEYGNLITINICNDKHFEGIITFGKWQNNIDNEENWINKECQIILDDDKDEILYKKAEGIFKKSTMIRTIPVVNKYNHLVANIERFDSTQELEQSIVGDLWDSMHRLTSEKELNLEFDIIREIIKRSKYKLIGSNYLAKQLEVIFGLESVTDYNQFEFDRNEFDFIIDMDIAYMCVRKKYAGKWYESVYSCVDFLEEVLEAISGKRYSRWQDCLNEEYYNLDKFLKLCRARNIVIQNNRLMTKEYATYFLNHNYHIEYSNKPVEYSNKPGIYMDMVLNGVYHLQNRIRVEEAFSLEKQLINLNIRCKSLNKKVHILNFDIGGILPFNTTEKRRFEDKNQRVDWFTFNKEELQDFFGPTYDANDWINLAREAGAKQWVSGRGPVSCNVNLKDFMYFNHIRYTTDVPSTYQNTIYFFGVCTVEGVCVKDEDTIESIIQKKINSFKKPYRVVNLGNIYDITIENIFRSISFEEGDIIVTIFLNTTEKTRKTIPILDLTQAFQDADEQHETFFLDMVAHCNANANRRMANFIFNYLKPLLTISRQIEKKKHSLYTIFNNDKDIEWAEEQVKKYISNLEIVRKHPYIVKQNNAAIVMNANPFSKGHLFLVEEAARKCDILFVFVLEEDKSFFSFNDRIAMVKRGTKHISNVVVIPSGKFIISQQTFPGYFRKEKYCNEQKQGITIKMDPSVDVRIFGKYIAKSLGIKKRFVGDEKSDMVTEEYNNALNTLLPMYDVQVYIIKRKTLENEIAISASLVRKALSSRDWKTICKLVPKSTFEYILELYS